LKNNRDYDFDKPLFRKIQNHLDEIAKKISKIEAKPNPPSEFNITHQEHSVDHSLTDEMDTAGNSDYETPDEDFQDPKKELPLPANTTQSPEDDEEDDLQIRRAIIDQVDKEKEMCFFCLLTFFFFFSSWRTW
jgi:hypothetical protein